MKLRARSLSLARTLIKSETGVKTAFPCKAKENPRKSKNSKFFPWRDLKGRLRRKSRKTWDLNESKQVKIWVVTPQEHQSQAEKTEERLDEAFTTSEISALTSSQLSWSTDGCESPDEMLHSTPRRPQDELRRIRVGTYPAGSRTRSLTLDALNMAARIVTLETPSPMVARRRAQEDVRRTLMEKSLEAVIEEAKMELRQEQEESPERSPVYQNVDFNYENENFNFNEDELLDLNSNCSGSKQEHSYQNLSAFYENIDIQDSFGQHSYEIIGFPSETRRLHILAKNYEDMDCKVLSQTYVEMTPVKCKLVTAV